MFELPESATRSFLGENEWSKRETFWTNYYILKTILHGVQAG